MPRKAEFTFRICIRISPKTRREKLDRIATILHARLITMLPVPEGRIVHTQHNVRTWYDAS